MEGRKEERRICWYEQFNGNSNKSMYTTLSLPPLPIPHVYQAVRLPSPPFSPSLPLTFCVLGSWYGFMARGWKMPMERRGTIVRAEAAATRIAPRSREREGRRHVFVCVNKAWMVCLGNLHCASKHFSVSSLCYYLFLFASRSLGIPRCPSLTLSLRW